jgi:hypothetical protein
MEGYILSSTLIWGLGDDVQYCFEEQVSDDKLKQK